MNGRLFLLGATSILAQVVLLRELHVAFFGSELIYLVGLSFWLFGTGAGALAARRVRASDAFVRGTFVFLAAAVPLLCVALRGLRLMLGAPPGGYAPFPAQIAATALALAPVTLAAGAVFPLILDAAARSRPVHAGHAMQDKEPARPRSIALAYAVESAGALGGGTLATLLPAAGASNLFGAFLVPALVAAGLRAGGGTGGRRRFAVVAAAVVLALAASARLDAALTRWNHPDLVRTADTPYGRVTLTRADGRVALFENDALSFESEGTGAEELAHLAALEAERTDRILLVGGVADGFIRELLFHRPTSLVALEQNGTLLDMVRAELPGRLGETSPGIVRAVVGDPRRSLPGDGSFDLVVIGAPEPLSGQANRFHTREFFLSCRTGMTSDGVLALRLRGNENLSTPLDLLRLSAVERALRSVFADVLIVPASERILLASDRPLVRDPGVLIHRIARRGVATRLVGPAWLTYRLTGERTAAVAEAVAALPAPINADARPVCYAWTQLLWLSRFFPRLLHEAGPPPTPGAVARSPILWGGTALVAGGLLALRRRAGARAAWIAATAGALGMLVESAVILHHQTRTGALYRDLGILLALFMAGLAAGSAWGGRDGGAGPRASASRAGAPLAGAAPPVGLARRGVRLHLLAAALIGGLLAAWIERGGGGWVAAGALGATGWITGALFAGAARLRGDRSGGASTLYGADLVGGGIGLLAAGIVLIPWLGLPATCVAAAALALLALLAA